MTSLFNFTAIETSIAALEDVTVRIATRNRLFDDLFEQDVKKVGWLRRRPGDRLPPLTGHVIVMGVVLWNELDRRLLQEAAAILWNDVAVSIFDLDDVRSAAQLKTIVPGVPLLTKTPLVAEYENGILKRFATSTEALALVRGATVWTRRR